MKRHVRVLLGVCACLCLTGCGGEATLDTSYGSVRRPSLNGIGVFVDMLKATGHRVDILPAITPHIHRYSRVIIFHDKFGPVSKETEEFLTAATTSEQVIIIALRDCDWAIDYWERIAGQIEKKDPARAAAARKASGLARIRLLASTSAPVPTVADGLYGLETVPRQGIDRARTVKLRSWTDGDEDEEVTEIGVDFPLQRRLRIATSNKIPEAEFVVWSAGDDPLLLSYQPVGGSHLMILGTTAPLLNAGLVDPGNRRLTEQFIERLYADGPIAVVTSSLLLSDEEDISLWRFAKIFPHPWILGQSLVALGLFCWWRWPIFGRPHTDQHQETKRFGHHVAAVGELLARTGDIRFALQRIQEWQRVQEHRKGRRG